MIGIKDRDRLLKLLMLSKSDNVNEVASTMRVANRLLADRGVSWDQIIRGGEKTKLDRAKEFVMPFGKHRGMCLGEIPDGYLEWLYEHCENQRISELAGLVLEAR
jgi:uncharacterized protein (DUF3820 family)